MSDQAERDRPSDWAIGVALAALRLEAARQRGAAQHSGPWARSHRKRGKALDAVISWMEALANA